MKLLSSLISEPLFVFLVLGGLLFLADHQLNSNDKPELIVSEATRAAVLEQQHNLRGSKLSVEEQVLAIDEFVDEEILLKEAYRLGLDKDQIIRTRLLRKIRYILSADQREPTEEELRRYYSANLDKFAQQDTINIEQVFFDLENPPFNNVLEKLNADFPSVKLGNKHARFPNRVEGESLEEIMARFCKNVSEAISGANKGEWYGPLISPYGQHFIRVISVHKGSISPYLNVKKYVKNGWIKEEQNKANTKKIEALRNQYSIRIEGVQ